MSICDLLSWRKADEVDLNDSQLDALKDALTKEFSVIQGPPGTGRIHSTFISHLFYHTTLHNFRNLPRFCTSRETTYLPLPRECDL